jgi:hypothetical protein
VFATITITMATPATMVAPPCVTAIMLDTTVPVTSANLTTEPESISKELMTGLSTTSKEADTAAVSKAMLGLFLPAPIDITLAIKAAFTDTE